MIEVADVLGTGSTAWSIGILVNNKESPLLIPRWYLYDDKWQMLYLNMLAGQLSCDMEVSEHVYIDMCVRV